YSRSWCPRRRRGRPRWPALLRSLHLARRDGGGRTDRRAWRGSRGATGRSVGAVASSRTRAVRAFHGVRRLRPAALATRRLYRVEDRPPDTRLETARRRSADLRTADR